MNSKICQNWDIHARSHKPLEWTGSAKEELLEFPLKVVKVIGHTLDLVQRGQTPVNVKSLRGFGGSSVLEVIEDHDGDTFRAVYTVRFKEAVFVLHCFQKKSKSGIATPKRNMDLVNSRLKQLEREIATWQKASKKNLK